MVQVHFGAPIQIEVIMNKYSCEYCDSTIVTKQNFVAPVYCSKSCAGLHKKDPDKRRYKIKKSLWNIVIYGSLSLVLLWILNVL